MTTEHELYDLQDCFIQIRDHVNAPYVKKILYKLKEVFCCNTAYSDNRLRGALSEITELRNNEEWSFIFINNYYTHRKIYKNDKIICFISDVLDLCIRLLESAQLEQLYDLVDTIHCLPEIFIGGSKKGYRRFWKERLNVFQKKWKYTLFNSYKTIL